MSIQGFRLPQNDQSFEDTFKFLVWNQFPAILESSVRFFATLPSVGIYKHFQPNVKTFKDALLTQASRQFTLSGVGSFIDFEKYGHTIKRPTPQLAGTGCNGNTLCIEPTCFGFTEGVIESNNILRDICWSLAMPCLKDQFYSERDFNMKMQRYFGMFFQQPVAVSQAYQRTVLLQEAIKIVCTDKNFNFTGPVIGGGNQLSLPFYVDPVNALEFPDISALPGGATIGGANLAAFARYMAPRLFSGSFSGGMEGVKIYGLKHDYMVAKEQTLSVTDNMADASMIQMLRALGAAPSQEKSLDALMGGEFTHDPMFPTWDLNGGMFEINFQEILEPATIAGYVQSDNPRHSLANVRGLLFVPDNWKFSYVTPPKDNFSDLGLGEGLNFAMQTPGVRRLLSSSLFTRNRIGRDGIVVLGQKPDPKTGFLSTAARGLERRERALQEAIRTELLLTYSTQSCENATPGQLPNVGKDFVPQKAADGFQLKSTAYFATDVVGQARPVLLLFKTDNPRSARPIEVCDPVEVTVDTTPTNTLEKCCPGGKPFAVLTFRNDASGEFTVGDTAVFRTGARGQTYQVNVDSVDANCVVVSSQDGTTPIPCCTGSPDDYGVRGDLINTTNPTATESEIFKAQYDSGSNSYFLETLVPLAPTVAGQTGTITLDSGETIDIEVVANAQGVFIQVQAGAGETCDLSLLSCHCLLYATVSF